MDRSATSVRPAGDVTGPAETGPAVAPGTGSDGNGYRIPPAGTAVSTPVEGELIAETWVGGAGQIRVYADERVLSAQGNGGTIVERRLSSEGVELVRQVLGERASTRMVEQHYAGRLDRADKEIASALDAAARMRHAGGSREPKSGIDHT